MVEGGTDSLTTTHVAERTGFAVGTIYQYFSNRSDLLMAAHDRMLERISVGISQAASTVDLTVGDPIDEMIRLYVETAKSYPGYLALLNFAHVHQSMEDAGAVVDASVGDIVSFFVRHYAPDACEVQVLVSRTVIVNILNVLTDVVLLERDPCLQERYLQEMIGLCRFALEKGARRPAASDLQ